MDFEARARRIALGGLSAVVVALTVAMAWGSEIERLPLGGTRGLELGAADVGELYDAATGEVVSLERAVERLADADVILIGEDHTHLEQKVFQARLLEALLAAGRVPALGMEFFQRRDAAVLEQWSDGLLEGTEFLRESGWLSRGIYNWEYYRRVMEIARRHELRVVGLNIPRDVVRTVSREGFEALSDEQRDIVGDVDPVGFPEHRYLFCRYLGDAVARMPAAWLDRMYAAQCVWDASMARSILEALPEGGQVVAIAGSGHVVYGLGIARHLRLLASDAGFRELRIATVAPVVAPAAGRKGMHGHPTVGAVHGDDESPRYMPAVFSRSYADIIAVFGDPGGLEAYPRLSLGLEEGEEGSAIVVGRVWPDSLAQRLGFQMGDRVVRLAEWVGGSLEDLRLELFELRWWTSFVAEVERRGEIERLEAVLVPDVEADERELVAGWSLSELESFDPERGLAETRDGSAAKERDVLYDDPEGVRRVVRFEDEIPVAVYELDDTGSVVDAVRVGATE